MTVTEVILTNFDTNAPHAELDLYKNGIHHSPLRNVKKITLKAITLHHPNVSQGDTIYYIKLRQPDIHNPWPVLSSPSNDFRTTTFDDHAYAHVFQPPLATLPTVNIELLQKDEAAITTPIFFSLKLLVEWYWDVPKESTVFPTLQHRFVVLPTTREFPDLKHIQQIDFVDAHIPNNEAHLILNVPNLDIYLPLVSETGRYNTTRVNDGWVSPSSIIKEFLPAKASLVNMGDVFFTSTQDGQVLNQSIYNVVLKIWYYPPSREHRKFHGLSAMQSREVILVGEETGQLEFTSDLLQNYSIQNTNNRVEKFSNVKSIALKTLVFPRLNLDVPQSAVRLSLVNIGVTWVVPYKEEDDDTLAMYNMSVLPKLHEASFDPRLPTLTELQVRFECQDAQGKWFVPSSPSPPMFVIQIVHEAFMW